MQPENETKAKIGFIGLGIMGSRMAENLQKHRYALAVFNRTRSKAESLLGPCGTFFDSPAKLAGEVNILFTMLAHPNASYAGVYESPLYGRLTIEQRSGTLVAKMAQLAAPVEAFTEPETARVELVPGSGEVLRFTFGPGEAAESVQWADEVFRRVR